MKILHICNNFTANRIYLNLFNEIASNNCTQEVIAPIRCARENGMFMNECECCKIYYPHVIRTMWDRIFFRRKIRKTLSFVLKKVQLDNTSLLHAHTLFSDGAVAYELFCKIGIPYIVAIRNTDVNIFLKYLPFLRNYGLSILEAAKRVIFISDSYRSHLHFFYHKWYENNVYKFRTILNGIDSFWLKNRVVKHSRKDDRFKLIFSGDFNYNKNLHSVIKAVLELNRSGYCIEFEAVGLGRQNEDIAYVKYLNALRQGHECIKFSRALPRDLLLAKIREFDAFVMPSFSETFGLAYAEALSQGLPLIYSEGQGFDGIFQNGVVGCSVVASSVDDIKTGIESIISDYNVIINNIACQPLDKLFAWSSVSKLYFAEYKSVALERGAIGNE